MKKIILLLLALLMMSGCGVATSKKPVDTKYTEAYTAVETGYIYKYDVFSGGFVMVPDIRTVHHDESYSIQWEITYTDGDTRRVWKTCTYTEYQNAQKTIAASSK